MQGQQGLGGQPVQMPRLSRSLSDLAQAAGELSVHEISEDRRVPASEVPGRQSGDGVACWGACPRRPLLAGGARILGHREGFSTCTASGLDPGEPSSAWGDFESFQGSPARSEQFSQFFELPERPTEPQPPRTASAHGEHGAHQPHQGGPWLTGTTAVTPSEPTLSYENIFRFAFQEVPVQQATEDVPTLDYFLEMSSEEKPGLESVHKLCSEPRSLWRALQSTDGSHASRRLRSGSHCQESLFLVLGVDAAQKNLSRGQGHTGEGSDLEGPKELGVHSVRLHHCRALIQTKLSGTPGGRPGSLITYSLSLKTPIRGSQQYIAIPGKKLFTARNLKMTLFNSDVC
ncbi:hypothetical protein MM560_G19n269 [Manis javanica]|nr:hypothetical protein MM560_G19n269 [Manis javanica]